MMWLVSALQAAFKHVGKIERVHLAREAGGFGRPLDARKWPTPAAMALGALGSAGVRSSTFDTPSLEA